MGIICCRLNCLSDGDVWDRRDDDIGLDDGWRRQGGRRRRLGCVDVHGQDLRLELSRLLLLGLWRLFVLLDVELAEEHDGLFAEDAARDWVGLVDAGAVDS